MRLKATGGDLETRGSQPLGEILVKPLGVGGQRGFRKGRAVALAAVRVQSKLRNHEQRAGGVEDRTVHLALRIGEDAQIGDLVGQRGGARLVILLADAQEHAQSGADFPDDLRADVDAGASDSLNDGTHGNQLASMRARRELSAAAASRFTSTTMLSVNRARAGWQTRVKFAALVILITLPLVFGRQGYAQLAARGEERKEAPASGRLVGKVVAAGKHQKPKPLPVFKNRSFCGAAVGNETLLVGKDGALRNAVVTLYSAGRAAAAPGQLILDNKKCAFAPHVQVAALGSEVLLKNSDPILHTVHARLGAETLFNVGLPRWRQVTKRLDRPGVIRITCDVLHTWMSAAIVVTDTPYVALSDANGAFVIEHLPAGTYEMAVWHERLGTLRREIFIDHGADATAEIVYAPEKPG